MANSLPVSRAVKVSLTMSPRAAAGRDFGAVLVIGTSDAIPVIERIREYGTYEEVLADFGASSHEAEAAAAFFGQEPTPSQLLIGRWAKNGAAGEALCKIIPENAQDLEAFKDIESGTLTMTIDGAIKTVSSLDFSEISNYNGAASVINAALNGARVVWTGSRFRFVSNTSGASSSISAISSTNLGTVMGLDSIKYINGVDTETITDCMTAFLDEPGWYACFIADSNLSADDVVNAAKMVNAASLPRIIAVNSRDSGELDSQDDSTVGAKLAASNNNRALCVYSSTSDYAAVSFLARMATVNYSGSNTALTMKFKQLPGFEAEHLTTSQANALQAKNVNAFVAYQNDTAIVQEGVMSGGWFCDERKDLDWLSDSAQNAAWNLLYTSGTKIPQTDAGIARIVSTLNKAISQGVTNGIIGGGVWNGDEFGSLKAGDTLPSGFYIYAQPLSEQSQADREARKAPAIQIAVKLAGAVHFADVSISVNR